MSDLLNRYLRPFSASITPTPMSSRNLVISPYIALVLRPTTGSCAVAACSSLQRVCTRIDRYAVSDETRESELPHASPQAACAQKKAADRRAMFHVKQQRFGGAAKHSLIGLPCAATASPIK